MEKLVFASQIAGGSKFDQWGWTDADLYRAIDNPEHPEGMPARDAEIAEYVAELRRRKAVVTARAAREEELRSKYRIE